MTGIGINIQINISAFLDRMHLVQNTYMTASGEVSKSGFSMTIKWIIENKAEATLWDKMALSIT